MAKRKRRPIVHDADGSSEIKGSAESSVEFTPVIDDKPAVERGTCDNCKYNRYHVSSSAGQKGLCEIGNLLRGHTMIPPENTCDHWEAQS